ncbi:DNA binding protein [Thiohalocapsa phage LS06-2018-MD03]|nr:DNA binding protein [Thiohalocapsa phage LS06-2018-MD03]
MKTMKYPIYAPIQWWSKDVDENCNGCGSELDISGKIVPDHLLGLSIKEFACCPHDDMYERGITKVDKLFADVMFLYNMVAIILNEGGYLVVPRLLLAFHYFIAVVKKGDASFIYDKNEIDVRNYISFKGQFIYEYETYN